MMRLALGFDLLVVAVVMFVYARRRFVDFAPPARDIHASGRVDDWPARGRWHWFELLYPYTAGVVIIVICVLGNIFLVGDPSISMTAIPATVLLALAFLPYDWRMLWPLCLATTGLNLILDTGGELIFDTYPLWMTAAFFTLAEMRHPTPAVWPLRKVQPRDR